MYLWGVIAEKAQRNRLTLLILQMRKQALESFSNLPQGESELEAETRLEPCIRIPLHSYNPLSQLTSCMRAINT